MRVLQAKTRRPFDLVAVGAGRHVAAASTAFDVRWDVEIWDVTTGRTSRVYPVRQRCATGLAFTPDGRWLVIGESDGVVVLDMATREVRPGPATSYGYPHLALSPAGDRLLVGEVDIEFGRVACWAASEGPTFQLLWQDEPQPRLFFVAPAIDPTGRWMAVVERDVLADRPREAIQVRDSGGRLLHAIRTDPADPIGQLAFTADGTCLLSIGRGRAVQLWDPETGEPAGELVHPGRPFVTGMAVHPGGTLACSRNDGTVCFWNVERRELVRVLDWKLGKLVSVAFSSDGNIGAAGTERGEVVVWDVDV